MLTDTHCHLDQLDDSALSEAADAGVTAVVAVAQEAESMRAVLDLAARWPGQVFAGLGIHPCVVTDRGFDQLAPGEVSSAADALAKCLKAIETAIRDSGAWGAARWVDIAPGEVALAGTFEAEALRRDQTRSTCVATYQGKLKGKTINKGA